MLGHSRKTTQISMSRKPNRSNLMMALRCVISFLEEITQGPHCLALLEPFDFRTPATRTLNLTLLRWQGTPTLWIKVVSKWCYDFDLTPVPYLRCMESYSTFITFCDLISIVWLKKASGEDLLLLIFFVVYSVIPNTKTGVTASVLVIKDNTQWFFSPRMD